MSELFNSAVARVKQALAKHPELRLIESEESIRVEVDDPNGFDVAMFDDDNELTVVAGEAYHEHLAEAEEAAAGFLWMLTPRYRIVEERRGKHIKSARLEWEEAGMWESRGGMVVAVPLFGRKRTHIFQNHVLTGPDEPH